MDKTVAELFAGVGGFRYALNDVKLGNDGKAIESGEWDFVFANQWEPSTKKQDAYECYKARFGGEEATNEDIFQVDKASMPDFSLLVGGFPCLVGDTLVLTDKGYKAIVDVIPNEDRVMGDDGEYHNILNLVYSGNKQCFTIEGYGFDSIIATGNHRFYVRKKQSKVARLNGKSTRIKTFLEPSWIDIETLAKEPNSKDIYFGMPVDSHSIIPEFSQFKKLDMRNPNLWYLAGRYVADGCLLKDSRCRDEFRGIGITCGKSKIEQFVEHTKDFYSTCTVLKSVNQYSFRDSELAHFMRLFGEHAHNKSVPSFVLSLPVDLLEHFCQGYLDGDGCKIDNKIQYGTVSKKLAYGMAAVLEKVYKKPCQIYLTKVNPEKELEGRIVKQRPWYLCRCVLSSKHTTAFYEDGYIWYPLHKITKQNIQPVYDIEVETVHSFIANGAIAHNCQNYSVAATAKHAKGIEGEKGVLWWAINDILNTKKPAFVFLENVDRLLLSPSKQRGRDFGIILRCFHDAGYDVQWRVINAGEYGYQQKRRRAYIVAYRNDTNYAAKMAGFTPREIICSEGIFSKGFPVKPDFLKENNVEVGKDAYSMIGQLSEEFRADFFNAGVMIDGSVYTAKTESDCDETFALRNLLEADGVDERYFLDRDKCEKFKYLKGSKRIPRKKPNGEDYIYSEGAMPCPDNPDAPARTILTSESGTSRTTHVVSDPKTGKWRLLTPVECERINGFPDGWTDTGMTEKRRYFMMGNALVVDVVAVIGQAIGEAIEQES